MHIVNEPPHIKNKKKKAVGGRYKIRKIFELWNFGRITSSNYPETLELIGKYRRRKRKGYHSFNNSIKTSRYNPENRLITKDAFQNLYPLKLYGSTATYNSATLQKLINEAIMIQIIIIKDKKKEITCWSRKRCCF